MDISECTDKVGPQLKDDIYGIFEELGYGYLGPAVITKASKDILDRCIELETDDVVETIREILDEKQLDECISIADERFYILAIVLLDLRQRQGIANKKDKDDWGYLQRISSYLASRWQLPPGEEVWGLSDPIFRLIDWKNINMFVAFLANAGFDLGIHLGILEISRALEEPTITPLQQPTLEYLKQLENFEEYTIASNVKCGIFEIDEPDFMGFLMDCRVWVAATYFIHCSQTIFREMTLYKDKKRKEKIPKTGPLYGENLPPCSLERWGYWKKRLAELGESKNLGIREDWTKEYIAGALKAMDECQSKLGSEVES